MMLVVYCDVSGVSGVIVMSVVCVVYLVLSASGDGSQSKLIRI